SIRPGRKIQNDLNILTARHDSTAAKPAESRRAADQRAEVDKARQATNRACRQAQELRSQAASKGRAGAHDLRGCDITLSVMTAAAFIVGQQWRLKRCDRAHPKNAGEKAAGLTPFSSIVPPPARMSMTSPSPAMAWVKPCPCKSMQSPSARLKPLI